MKTLEENVGTKHDGEKVRLDLLSSEWITGVGDVLTFGAKKYEAHNWRKGIQLSRLLGACLRHVFAFLKGEDKDPETGLLHLYHASCCLMFASELYIISPEKVDDRFKVVSPVSNKTNITREHFFKVLNDLQEAKLNTYGTRENFYEELFLRITK